MRPKIIILFFSILYISYSETLIKGDIKAVILDSSGNPFIVESDIVINQNEKVIIKPGCVFLFKQFTSLDVFGSLFVEGTEDKPVIFTSINDKDYNKEVKLLPNAFDWNGINIAQQSDTVTLSNFKLMYSVYGIKSTNENIRIKNGIFKVNGQFHLTINNKIHYVVDNEPYSFNIEEKKDISVAEPIKDTTMKDTAIKTVVMKDTITKNIKVKDTLMKDTIKSGEKLAISDKNLKKSKKQWKKGKIIAVLSSGVVAAGGFAYAIWNNKLMQEKQRLYNDAKSKSEATALGEEMDKKYKLRNIGWAVMYTGIVTGVGIVIFF
jgi:hypothetical protein